MAELIGAFFEAIGAILEGIGFSASGNDPKPKRNAAPKRESCK
jgi:hypothetical protein